MNVLTCCIAHEVCHHVGKVEPVDPPADEVGHVREKAAKLPTVVGSRSTLATNLPAFRVLAAETKLE
jgi:hypothetical protein